MHWSISMAHLIRRVIIKERSDMTRNHYIPALLEVHDLSMRFGGIDALSHISFSVEPRQLVAIVGDNGAGKSTLLKILSGLLKPSSGSIRFKGKEVSFSSIRDANNAGIASVFQEPQFCDNLSISANLFLGNELKDKCGLRDDSTMFSRAKQALKTLTSAVQVSREMEGLSSGQRQTVAIARTLLSDPDLILLDEPTNSLSVMQTGEVLQYLSSLRSQNKTVLMVMHDLPDVFAVCDSIIVLRQGTVRAIHRVEETSYEEVIAEIAGVSSQSDTFQRIVDNPKVDGLIHHHRLIDRSRETDDDSDIDEVVNGEAGEDDMMNNAAVEDDMGNDDLINNDSATKNRER